MDPKAIQAQMDTRRDAERRAGPLTKARPAYCHPEAPLYRLGLCRECYLTSEDTPAHRQMLQHRRFLEKLEQDHITLQEYVVAARTRLLSNMEEYAKLHLEAAQVAAGKGDAKPAEFALSRVKNILKGKSVIPAEPKHAPAGDTGVKVMIGVNLGHLPENAVKAEIIDASGAENPAADGDVSEE